MKKITCVGLTAAGALWVSPALAEKPYYFHKTGVSRDQYMDDVNDCAELAGGVRVPHYTMVVTGPNIATNAIAAGIGSFFVTLSEGRERRRLISRVERTCMADKGYQRRSLDENSRREINRLEGTPKIERLFLLVSADQPSGQALVE